MIPDSLKNLSQDQIKKLLELQKKLDEPEDLAKHFGARRDLEVVKTCLNYTAAQAPQYLNEATRIVVETKLPSLAKMDVQQTDSVVGPIKRVIECVDNTQLNQVYEYFSRLIEKRPKEVQMNEIERNVNTALKVLDKVKQLKIVGGETCKWLKTAQDLAHEGHALNKSMETPLPVPLLDAESNPLLLGTGQSTKQARAELLGAIEKFTGKKRPADDGAVTTKSRRLRSAPDAPARSVADHPKGNTVPPPDDSVHPREFFGGEDEHEESGEETVSEAGS